MDLSSKVQAQFESLKNINHKPLRDLLALLSLPQLLTSKSILLKDILSDPHFVKYKLPNLTSPPKKLGLYAELLFKEILLQNSRFDILYSNKQVIIKGITLGEIDYLLKHNEAIIHLEMASKFYIKTPNGQLIGPNCNDKWSEKKELLESKQSRLVNQHLNYFGLSHKVEEKVLVLARTFVLDSTFKSFFFAIYQKDCHQLVKCCAYYQIVELKSDWLFPFYIEKSAFLEVETLPDLEINKWLKISLYTKNKSLIGSGFILNNKWPN